MGLMAVLHAEGNIGTTPYPGAGQAVRERSFHQLTRQNKGKVNPMCEMVNFGIKQEKIEGGMAPSSKDNFFTKVSEHFQSGNTTKEI